MADDKAPAVPASFSYKLVVHDTFTNSGIAFKRGDMIEDPKIIAAIMDTHHESFVTKVAK